MMKARVDLYLHGLFISKNFLGGKFHKNILPRGINIGYYERETYSIFKNDGGKNMFIILCTFGAWVFVSELFNGEKDAYTILNEDDEEE